MTNTRASVMDFGAVGDGAADDRAAFQSALDWCAGGDVFVPMGRYALGRMPSAIPCSLRIPPGTRLFGDFAEDLEDMPTLVSATGTEPSVRMLYADGPRVTIENLRLDGGDPLGASSQRHGIFANNAPSISVIRVEAFGFGGDGLYINEGTVDPRILMCNFHHNRRNGITFGGQTHPVNGLVDKCQVANNAAQQIDSEPKNGMTVSRMCIRRSWIVSGDSRDYALTISGSGADAVSEEWTVEKCAIAGAVLARWASGMRFTDNAITNSTLKPGITVDRNSNDVLIYGNSICNVQEVNDQVDGNSVIYVVGTSAGNRPGKVCIIANLLQSIGRSDVYGIRCSGARSVQIEDNVIHGSGLSGSGNGAGIFLRATMTDTEFESAVIQRNGISECSGYGIRVAGNGAARLGRLTIVDNEFFSAIPRPGIMLAGMHLNDGTGCVTNAFLAGNTADGCDLGPVPPLLTGSPLVWGAKWTRPVTP